MENQKKGTEAEKPLLAAPAKEMTEEEELPPPQDQKATIHQKNIVVVIIEKGRQQSYLASAIPKPKDVIPGSSDLKNLSRGITESQTNYRDKKKYLCTNIEISKLISNLQKERRFESMKMKHNKKRNTAFIYEAIIRELAKSIHEGDDKKVKTYQDCEKKLSQQYFARKDLELYKSILETKNVDRYTAEKIVFQSRVQKNTINHKLFEDQSKLIEEINKEISPDVFSNFVQIIKIWPLYFRSFTQD